MNPIDMLKQEAGGQMSFDEISATQKAEAKRREAEIERKEKELELAKEKEKERLKAEAEQMEKLKAEKTRFDRTEERLKYKNIENLIGTYKAEKNDSLKAEIVMRLYGVEKEKDKDGKDIITYSSIAKYTTALLDDLSYLSYKVELLEMARKKEEEQWQAKTKELQQYIRTLDGKMAGYKKWREAQKRGRKKITLSDIDWGRNEALKNAGVTQKDRAKYLGVSDTTLRKLERELAQGSNALFI